MKRELDISRLPLLLSPYGFLSKIKGEEKWPEMAAPQRGYNLKDNWLGEKDRWKSSDHFGNFPTIITNRFAQSKSYLSATSNNSSAVLATSTSIDKCNVEKKYGAVKNA